jgi:hypothetical protein
MRTICLCITIAIAIAFPSVARSMQRSESQFVAPNNENADKLSAENNESTKRSRENAAVSSVERELEFPYTGRVIVQTARILSGPGERHYVCEELPKGAEVEVYRHDPDGWCAIRPLVDSFSLIPASSVEVVSNDLARITEVRAKVWVGTSVESQAEPLWQVALPKDDQVRLIAKVRFKQADGEELWYKIAPPAGEFRWIHIDDFEVLPTPAEQDFPSTNAKPFGAQDVDSSSAKIGESPSQDIVAADVKAASQENSDDQTTSAKNSQPKARNGWRPIDADALASPDMQDRSFDRESNEDPDDLTKNRDQSFTQATYTPRDEEASSEGLPPQDDSTEQVPADFRSLYRKAELALSLEVLKTNSEEWNLKPLRKQAVSLARIAESTEEKNQIAEFAKKLDSFTALQWDRHGAPGRDNLDNDRQVDRASLDQPEETSSFADELESAMKETEANLKAKVELTLDQDDGEIGAGAIDEAPKADLLYDGSGILNRLYSNEGKGPAIYVLQDENGKILKTVTPAPGYNLNRYLKQSVGIVGRRGFNQKLKTPHVTAERVILLERMK